jgi:hypothetical protein
VQVTIGSIYPERQLAGPHEGDIMLNFLTTVDARLLLQMAIPIAALATFFGFILSENCSVCSWFEWVGSPSGSDDEVD